jgi:hypothetical protein
MSILFSETSLPIHEYLSIKYNIQIVINDTNSKNELDKMDKMDKKNLIISNLEKLKNIYLQDESKKWSLKALSFAINEIKKWALENNDRPLMDETVLVEGALTKLEKDVRLGTVYPQDAGIRQSQINSGILDLPNHASTHAPEVVTFPVLKQETETNGKLKILMLTANPAGSYQLELEKEHSRITKKLREKTEQFSLIVHHAVNNTEFKELNETAKPNVLHFSGHGNSNGIMLQNDDKNGAALLTARALDALFEYFADEGILFKAVVLNACYTEDQAQAIANHVPYVIASTTAISDEAAIAFSVGFYFKLDAQGGNIEQSFRSGRTQAVTTGAEKAYFILFKDGAKIEA